MLEGRLVKHLSRLSSFTVSALPAKALVTGLVRQMFLRTHLGFQKPFISYLIGWLKSDQNEESFIWSYLRADRQIGRQTDRQAGMGLCRPPSEIIQVFGMKIHFMTMVEIVIYGVLC